MKAKKDNVGMVEADVATIEQRRAEIAALARCYEISKELADWLEVKHLSQLDSLRVFAFLTDYALQDTPDERACTIIVNMFKNVRAIREQSAAAQKGDSKWHT